MRINSHWAPVELVTGPQGVIDIADGVYINYGTLISAQSRVRIGADVMVGNYSIIGDTDVPGIGEPRRAPALEARDIEIGDGVWLAARVIVLPGARIGERAVIAAGSVVAGDIPSTRWPGESLPARFRILLCRGDAACHGAAVRSARVIPMGLLDQIRTARVAWALRVCESVGEEARLHGWPTVYASPGRIRIGKRFRLWSRPVESHLAAGPDGYAGDW